MRRPRCATALSGLGLDAPPWLDSVVPSHNPDFSNFPDTGGRPALTMTATRATRRLMAAGAAGLLGAGLLLPLIEGHQPGAGRVQLGGLGLLALVLALLPLRPLRLGRG